MDSISCSINHFNWINRLVLCVNGRVQQLKDEKYTNKERFDFISWLVSWAIPLLFNVKVRCQGIRKVR